MTTAGWQSPSLFSTHCYTFPGWPLSHQEPTNASLQMEGHRQHFVTRTTVYVNTNAGKNAGTAFLFKSLLPGKVCPSSRGSQPPEDSLAFISGTLAPQSLHSLPLQEALVLLATLLCNSSVLGAQNKACLFVFFFPSRIHIT